ncbi:MAG TPA: thiamine phosphate synthase [Burkholderiales bacterium]|jgi:thiamine-phosphate pyrophosphorylase|nr:thiamine phosphate synthase [Burkholderiales bacterium]
MKLRGLYAITPDSPDGLLEKAEAALRGGVAALQYRNKLRPESRAAEAKALAALARRYGVPFIVNDDIDVALDAGADGVHLGRDDESLSAALRRMPGRIIGVSCYDSLESARAAVAAGARYVAFGSVFASSTKPGAVRAPLSLFSEARSLGVPLCAIGGITLENAPRLVEAGADLLAVISDLFLAGDVESRARRYAEVFA